MNGKEGAFTMADEIVALYRITGDARPGAEFEMQTKPGNLTQATFVAVHGDEIRVVRRMTDVFDLPSITPVVAHWHGGSRTDGFATTVGDLKELSDEWMAAKRAR
jgi:hypothetical protein